MSEEKPDVFVTAAQIIDESDDGGCCGCIGCLVGMIVVLFLLIIIKELFLILING